MKKNILFISLVTLLLCVSSCGGQKNGSETANNNSDSIATNIATYELDSLLAVADQLIDKTVKVRGIVTHTCKHSGKRCFIVGQNEDASFRVEAGGEIGGFNKELVGSELDIVGIVRERRLTKEYIDQYEKEVEAEKVKEDGSAETCQAELSNIESMRKWMKENNKDYYSIFYMDGENYDVVEK